MSVVSRFDEIERTFTAARSRDALLADGTFRQLLFSRLDGWLDADRNILSLDVFDTLLLRDNSSELTRFVEIGSRMAGVLSGKRASNGRRTAARRRSAPNASRTRRREGPSLLPPAVDAFLARHLGTRASYRACEPVAGCREGSLTEIHRTASRLLTGTVDHAEAFIEAEIDHEATRMKPNALLLDYIRRHRARGGKVVLLSDMYMHDTQISALLRKLNVDLDLFDLLISSADTKVSKRSGGIFRLVERRMEAESGSFLHAGDSLCGDYVKARESGWRALHLPIPEKAIAQRQADHIATAERLATEFGLSVDIAFPR